MSGSRRTEEERSEDGFLEFGDAIDATTFEQILEMDDEDSDREFSKSIVYGFFEQAEVTFRNMQHCLDSKDLTELSHLGHFLKGSSATLGLNKVKDSCEKIQHFGGRKDEKGDDVNWDDAKCLSKIKDTLAIVKVEYADAEKKLRAFYQDSSS